MRGRRGDVIIAFSERVKQPSRRSFITIGACVPAFACNAMSDVDVVGNGVKQRANLNLHPRNGDMCKDRTVYKGSVRNAWGATN